MLWVGLGILGLGLMLFGAKFAWSEYQLYKPDRIWVPLSLPSGISMAEQKKLAEQIDGHLRSDAVLRKVMSDTGLQEKFGQADEDSAAKELDRRLFVEVGTAEGPNGSVPSVNIGLHGNGYERAVLEAAVTRIMKDVLATPGIDPANGKRLYQPPPEAPDSF